jgi:hypothetical protein
VRDVKASRHTLQCKPARPMLTKQAIGGAQRSATAVLRLFSLAIQLRAAQQCLSAHEPAKRRPRHPPRPEALTVSCGCGLPALRQWRQRHPRVSPCRHVVGAQRGQQLASTCLGAKLLAGTGKTPPAVYSAQAEQPKVSMPPRSWTFRRSQRRGMLQSSKKDKIAQNSSNHAHHGPRNTNTSKPCQHDP